jgi:hypothetical protein
VADFLYILNCSELMCLVLVTSMKLILLLCSTSKEKEHFGSML